MKRLTIWHFSAVVLFCIAIIGAIEATWPLDPYYVVGHGPDYQWSVWRWLLVHICALLAALCVAAAIPASWRFGPRDRLEGSYAKLENEARADGIEAGRQGLPDNPSRGIDWRNGWQEGRRSTVSSVG